MKRALAVLLLLSVGLTCCTAAAEANQPSSRRNPRRFERGTYFPTIAVRSADGQVRTRQVYPGYRSGFPVPAWLYYGYPHSGDGSLSPGF
jgi:hypothetical protein